MLGLASENWRPTFAMRSRCVASTADGKREFVSEARTKRSRGRTAVPQKKCDERNDTRMGTDQPGAERSQYCVSRSTEKYDQPDPVRGNSPKRAQETIEAPRCELFARLHPKKENGCGQADCDSHLPSELCAKSASK